MGDGKLSPLNFTIMCRQPLDFYDIRTRHHEAYLASNGWHFNDAACKYAISLMRKKNIATGMIEQLPIMEAQEVDEMLKRHGVNLENKIGLDYVYVANMGRYDFFKSSIPDEKHLAMYVKDVVDDVDAPDGTIMCQWYAKMVRAGIPVPWKMFNEDD